MDTSKNTAGELHDALFPHLNYLLRLMRRLEELRFPADDSLRVAATNAYDAACRLSREARNLAVRLGRR